MHRDGDWHRTAHIWVISRKYGVLLQRRAADKDMWPNMLDISAAGHLQAGDDPLEGALRELQEELGIIAEPEELQKEATVKFTAYYGDMTDSEFSDVYIYETERSLSEMTRQEEEISELVYVTPEEYCRMTEDPDSDLLVHEKEAEIVKQALRKRKLLGE